MIEPSPVFDRILDENRRRELDDVLAALPSKLILDSPEVRLIPKGLRQEIESGEKHECSVQTLAAELGVSMVCVPHFYLTDSPVPARSDPIGIVKSASRRRSHDVNDSTPLILRHDRDSALAGVSISTLHYAHAFHHALLDAFGTLLQGVWRTFRIRSVTQPSGGLKAA